MAAWRTYTNSSSLQTVLVVAGDRETAALWEQLFCEKGYHAVIEDAVRAVQMARILCPQLMLVDVDLPHTDRLALCHALKSASETALMVLTQPRPQEIFELYAAGVDECLMRPINPALALVKATAWIMRQRLLSANRITLGVSL